MIFTWELKIKFELDGKEHKVLVDKIVIKGHRPEKFYRVAARSGNRDIIRHNGQWIVCSGGSLPEKVLDALGAGIEKILGNDV